MVGNIPKMVQFFSCLADETRLKIVLSVLEESKSVTKIHESIGVNNLTLSAVSHQLTLLNNLGIIEFKKSGRTKIFHLSEKFCWCILRNALGHFKNQSACKACLEDKKNRNNNRKNKQ